MKTLSNAEIDNVESKQRVTLPRFYRKLLLEEGYGQTEDQKEIYHPSEINELYELKFDDESLLYNKYFPIGCNNRTQELWIIDVTNDKIASIWHETHEDDWPNENWSEYEVWIENNFE
ncbi:MAG: SMI1/KNR4 family protein [Gammaproteobacteria bacterium]|nr:SMI1/KNR4 family protein [Gammaproteobacteria bacterium]MDH5730131.1 SMI1/KNR4 family protein [Gammaproteobacteria bacterium]